MNVGWIGLGKLGLPIAEAIAAFDHTVRGIDLNEVQTKLVKQTDLAEIVYESELIFVAVQTPHEPEYEGVTRFPSERKDFDYTWLKDAILQVSSALDADDRIEERQIVIICTVLPGTIDREIKPLLSSKARLTYNPFFIAMGTEVKDFLRPEFVLLGTDEPIQGIPPVLNFYRQLHGRPHFLTDIKTAELIKVAYNTFIGLKIVFINQMMEICAKTGADVDDLTNALSMAYDRIISSKYMRAGMGDGGGCHPRDNIALSWLAQRLDLSYDLFGELMKAREAQTEWLAEVAEDHSIDEDLPLVLLGKTYKPDTRLTTGSPALLMANILTEAGVQFEHLDHTLERPLLMTNKMIGRPTEPRIWHTIQHGTDETTCGIPVGHTWQLCQAGEFGDIGTDCDTCYYDIRV